MYVKDVATGEEAIRILKGVNIFDSPMYGAIDLISEKIMKKSVRITFVNHNGNNYMILKSIVDSYSVYYFDLAEIEQIMFTIKDDVHIYAMHELKFDLCTIFEEVFGKRLNVKRGAV